MNKITNYFQLKKKKKKKKKKKRALSSDDEDFDEEVVENIPDANNNKPTKKKKKKRVSKSKPVKMKKKKPKKKKRKKLKKMVSMDSSIDGNQETAISPRLSQFQFNRNEENLIFDEEEDDDIVMEDAPDFDEEPITKNPKKKKKKKKKREIKENRKRKRDDIERNIEEEEEDLDDEPKAKRFKMNDYNFQSQMNNLPPRNPERMKKFKNVLEVIDKSRKLRRGQEQIKQGKLTPLETEIVKFKKMYPDLVLAIEVGYKFNFYGKDAFLASEILGIGSYNKKNFRSASFPTARLMYHLRKLVNKGHKVGVIVQKETAAIKSANKKSKGKLFVRKLDKIYTKATFVSDNIDKTEIDDCYMMAIFEDKNNISIVASEVSTGQVIWDDFVEDTGMMRRELHSRLISVKPVEILINEEGLVSIETEKLLKSLDFISRIERMNFKKVNESVVEETETEKMPENVKLCINVLSKYLKGFELNTLLNLSNPIHLQSKANHMILTGTALWNLEILQNQEGKRESSLFHFLDRTKTKFGKRLLKRWICNPLRNINEINSRLASVTYLMKLGDDSTLKKFHKSLKNFPDLERLFLTVIYSRIKPNSFLQMINILLEFFEELKKLKEIEIEDDLLEDVVDSIPLDDFVPVIEEVISSFDHEAAEKNVYTKLFTEEKLISKYPKIMQHQQDLNEIFEELKGSHLEEIRDIVGDSELEYKRNLKLDFLVEIDRTEVDDIDIPEDWVIFNQTKKKSRFLTPTVKECVGKMAFHEEHIAKLSKNIWKDLLKDFSKHYNLMRELVDKLSILDCLFSLSFVSTGSGFTKPQMIDNKKILLIKNGRHPIVERLLNSEGKEFVTNDIVLEENQRESIIVSGPNMGGKSIFIKMIAIIGIMAQIGCYVPCEVCQMSPLDKILTRMGAYDDISSGSSTFYIEASEASQILNHATENSLVILDELGRGTSTYDGTAIAYSTLDYLIQKHTFSLFVTHYPEVTKLSKVYPTAVNYHMTYVKSDDEESTDITFLYKAAQGTAESSYGINVGKLAGLTDDIIETASLKSNEMQILSERNTLLSHFLKLCNLKMQEGSNQNILNLQQEIKELF